jgi:membrane-bound lytic murein transglycosylase B
MLSAALACVSSESMAQRSDAAAIEKARREFLERMVTEHDFDRAELAALLEKATINQSILDAISRPAERVVPWHEYRKIFLTEERINAGVEFWRNNGAAIHQAAERYGVAPEMLVAIVGVETFFGRITGRYRVLDALATLAFAYPPRAKFFAGELEHFLLLSREEGPSFLEATGSYAGAMGAGQFIPSSFRAYAVDANEDGRRDLWTDWEDVMGSVANYFKKHDWRTGQPVVARATRRADFQGPEPTNSLDLGETVASLRAMGYEFETDLPASAPAAAYALEAEGGGSEYWVGFHNFRVITRYNRSPKYALAAYQLSQAIRSRLPDGGASE